MPYFRFDLGVPDDVGSGTDLTVGDVRNVLHRYGGELEGFVTPHPRAGLSFIVSGPELLGGAAHEIAETVRIDLFAAQEIEQPPMGLADPPVDYAAPPFYVWCDDCEATVELGGCPHT